MIEFLAQASNGGTSLDDLLQFVALFFVFLAGVMTAIYVLIRRYMINRSEDSDTVDSTVDNAIAPTSVIEKSAQNVAPLDSTLTIDPVTPSISHLPDEDVEEAIDQDVEQESEPHTMSDNDQNDDNDDISLDDILAADIEPLAPSIRAKTALPPPTSDEQLAPMMQVFRDAEHGHIVIALDGQYFTSLEQLQTARLDYRFINLVQELVDIADAAQVDARRVTPSGDSAPSSIAAPAELPPIRLSPQQPSADEIEIPSFTSAIKGAFSREKRDGAGNAKAPLSIAEQIEQLLQLRLAGHPEFGGQNIHVSPSADGGLEIEVNDEMYHSVDDIPLPEVRGFLQSVIDEWASQQ